MQGQPITPASEYLAKLSAYLPTFTNGLLVLALGIALGWVVKRAIVRVLIWLRLDRLASRVGWRAAFGKGDVRAALYNLVGTVGMAVVILFFLDNALQIWGLTVLFRFVDGLVFYLPNLLLVALIVGAGMLVSNMVSDRIEAALDEEGFAHARLLGRVARAALLTVVGALALWELRFAQQIVLVAFLVIFGAIGVAFAVAVGIGSARAVEHGWLALFEKKGDEGGNGR